MAIYCTLKRWKCISYFLLNLSQVYYLTITLIHFELVCVLRRTIVLLHYYIYILYIIMYAQRENVKKCKNNVFFVKKCSTKQLSVNKPFKPT